MTVAHKVATTYQSDFQYQSCDSMEGLESKNIMKDVEHQVHNNDVLYKI